jgi:hypothetical protein
MSVNNKTSLLANAGEYFKENFERINTGYSVAQTGLTFLQHAPSVSETVCTVQKLFRVVDIAFATVAYMDLCEKVNKKYEEFFSEHPVMFKIGTIATAIAISTLSYFAVGRIQTLFKPTLDLTQLAKDLSSEGLGQVHLNWSSHSFAQWLYCTRIITSLATACFSDDRATNLVSAGSQIVSLASLSQVHWIHYNNILETPLQKIAAQFKGIETSDVKALSTSVHVRIFPHDSLTHASNCVSETSHLRSTLKAVHEYVANLYHNSVWKRYWSTTHQYVLNPNKNSSFKYLLYTHRKIKYDIILQPCYPSYGMGCGQIPFLKDMKVKILDNTYGVIQANLFQG